MAHLSEGCLFCFSGGRELLPTNSQAPHGREPEAEGVGSREPQPGFPPVLTYRKAAQAPASVGMSIPFLLSLRLLFLSLSLVFPSPLSLSLSFCFRLFPL